MSLWLLLAASLAAPAPAQTRVAPVETPVPAVGLEAPDLHPMLLGTLDDPASPISREAASQVSALSSLADAGQLTPEAVERSLAAARNGTPTQRAAAALIRHALANPVVTASLSAKGQSTARVIDTLRAALPPGNAASADPGIARLFDGSNKPSLELEGVTVRGSQLMHRGEAAEKLGQGGWGIVFTHPRLDGAVAKMVALEFMTQLGTNRTAKETARDEEATAHRLSAAVAGPRHFGQVMVDIQPDLTLRFTNAIRRLFGRPEKRYQAYVSVRERIYGATIQRLAWDRKYGPEEHALVMRMLDRMADARIKVDDLKPANIMIGATKADPVRRAYVVDGGNLEAWDDSLSRDEVRRAIGQQAIAIEWKVDPYVGRVEKYRTVDELLNEALEQSRDKPLWRRIWDAIKDSYLNANFTAHK
jgi:hypothetical protein